MSPIVKMIALSNGINVLVDADDYDRVKDMTWSVSRIGSTRYAVNRVMVEGKMTYTPMHRLLAGASTGELVDHINGDGLDNRSGNLRIATKAQNAINSKLASNNTTGYRGVCFIPKRNRYQARLHRGGKKITSRFRATAEEAAADYKQIVLKIHGEFVRLEGGGLI